MLSKSKKLRPHLRKIYVFIDKFPLVGPLVWLLVGQYFAAQLVVASDWWPGYSWRQNVISDLGNTACGSYAGRFVCSPQHALMNISFILVGAAMAIVSFLIYLEFQRCRASLAAFVCLAVGGFGCLLVGLFPENTISQLHAMGAFLALVIGNVGIIALSLAIKRALKVVRLYTFMSGVISLSAFLLFSSGIYFGLGPGGMERLASYTQSLWLILFGLYMTSSHRRLQK